MAWDPQNNGVMNIHAAYGMFYDNMRTLQNFNELTWPQAKQIIITPADVPRSARRQVPRLVHQHGAAEHHGASRTTR